MFPCAHIHYSIEADQKAPDAQLIGAMLPDAATTAVISWTDLHETPTVDLFAAAAPEQAHVIAGVRHHVELDNRSHHQWRHEGGYAYVRQTPELRAAVQSACGVDEELARTISHNFIETAVDIHLQTKHPELNDRLQQTISEYDVTDLAEALGRWKQTDATVVAARLSEFLSFWTRHDLASVNGAVELWVELFALLNQHTFSPENASELRRDDARLALNLALELTATDFLEVTSP